MGLVFQIVDFKDIEEEQINKVLDKDGNPVLDKDGKEKEEKKVIKIKQAFPVNKLDIPYLSPYFDYEQYEELKKALASRLGIELRTMVGYGGDIKWSDLKEEQQGLNLLLNRAGYEGSFTEEQCGSLEMPLRTLSQNIENLYIRKQAEILSDLFKTTKASGKSLKFC